MPSRLLPGGQDLLLLIVVVSVADFFSGSEGLVIFLGIFIERRAVGYFGQLGVDILIEHAPLGAIFGGHHGWRLIISY